MIISHYMKGEHRACDEVFAEAEKAVIENDFAKAQDLFVKFAEDTLGHFEKEEKILFPAFEEVTGSKEGPTNVMRYEHEQMRELPLHRRVADDSPPAAQHERGADALRHVRQSDPTANQRGDRGKTQRGLTTLHEENSI